MPSDLYRFADASDEKVTLRVNGQPAPLTLEKGYARLERRWTAGDVIELGLPMPVRRVVAQPSVEADQGRVALQRGPLVYAAEWPDNPGGKVRNLLLPDDATLASEFRPDLLNGVQVVTGRAVALALDAEGKVTRQTQDFTAIPYYAWANRGTGGDDGLDPEPRDERAAAALADPGLQGARDLLAGGGQPPGGQRPERAEELPGRRAAPSSTGGPRRAARSGSSTRSTKPSRCRRWTSTGSTTRAAASAACRRPGASSTGTARNGSRSRPPGPTASRRTGTTPSRSQPVTTSGLRLEVVLPKEWSSGIQEWKVR